VDRLGATALVELAREVKSRPVLAVATTERAGLAERLPRAEHLALAPLGREAIATIAALYAPAGVDVPVADLAARSGGVPQSAHRLAAEWGRAEAACRLSPVAARAASGRGDLRRAEQELAASVAQVQAVRERAELHDAEAGAVVCPFMGLSSFDVGDAEVFFGRERLVAEMVARLVGAPLLGVVGPSGSGKSSAVRAGLLAELAGGVLPGSEHWAQVLLRPGEHPLRVLGHATDQADADGRLLLVVDQFEEVFTLCRDEAERSAFVDAIVVAAENRTRQAAVVLAVRADFYGRCAAYPKLARLLGANHVLVGAIERDGLRRAIELPAQRARLGIDPELVDRLLADVANEPGALPLLSSALLELWQRRDGRHLRLAAYERTGGVRSAVARLAEAAYARLNLEQQAGARRILLRLAGQDTAADAPVRRRVRFAELDADRDDEVRHVLDVLATSRLLTVAEGTVEVAHEALLREWPRLRNWLEEDAEGRRLHHQLAVAARDWDTGGRDSGELYRGARLASALDWSADHPAELNAVERALIDASRAHGEREARHARRANRRLRSLLVGAGMLLLLAVGAGLLFLDQRGAARGEARAAEAQRLGAQALVEDDLGRSLLLARQGVAIEDSLQTRSNLLAALMRSPAAIGVLHLAGARPLQIALRPDGRALVVSDDHGRVQFLDPVTRRTLRPPITPMPGGDPIMDLVFSRDGSRLALAGQGLVQLRDARTWRLIAAPSVPDAQYLNLAFSPDGRILSIPYTFTATGSIPTTMRRFDARTGAQLGRPRQIAPPDVLVDVLTFSSDGRLLVTAENRSNDARVLNRRAPAADREIVVRDARTLRPMRTIPGGAFGSELRGPEYTGSGTDRNYAVSPDGRTLAIGRDDGSVHFVDLRTGEVRTALGRQTAHITGVRFTPSGRFLVTVGKDANAIVWDVAAGSAEETLAGHRGPIVGEALDPHGRTLYTAAQDGNVIVWDLLGDRRLGTPFDAGTGSDALFWPSTAISRDGRMLATAQRGPPWRGAPGEPREGAISMIDLSTLKRRDVRIRGVPLDFAGDFAPVFPAFGPADSLVVSGPAGFLALADARTGRLTARLRGHRDFVFAPAVSADGKVIASTSIDSTLRLWDTRTRRQLGLPLQLHLGRLARTGDTPPPVALSPDGTTVAVSREAHGVDLLDVDSRRLLARVRVDNSAPSAIRFSRHGDLLLVGSNDGRVRLFSTAGWRPEGPAFQAHAGPVSSVDASPDAGTLLTAGADGQLLLWDRASNRPIGTSLPGPENAAMALFTPDGNHVMAVFANGRGYRWDVRPSSWKRRACAVAGRQLTRAEWEKALPGRDYRPAC
jgi:WD40 repeat protein